MARRAPPSGGGGGGVAETVKHLQERTAGQEMSAGIKNGAIGQDAGAKGYYENDDCAESKERERRGRAIVPPRIFRKC